MQKTIYVTEEQQQQIMKDSRGLSFTKRIVELAIIGAIVEDEINEIEEELFWSDSELTVQSRLKDLIKKGYLYEQNKEPKITFKHALGFFNNMYRKKYPYEQLP